MMGSPWERVPMGKGRGAQDPSLYRWSRGAGSDEGETGTEWRDGAEGRGSFRRGRGFHCCQQTRQAANYSVDDGVGPHGGHLPVGRMKFYFIRW